MGGYEEHGRNFYGKMLRENGRRMGEMDVEIRIIRKAVSSKKNIYIFLVLVLCRFHLKCVCVWWGCGCGGWGCGCGGWGVGRNR